MQSTHAPTRIATLAMWFEWIIGMTISLLLALLADAFAKLGDEVSSRCA